MASVAESATSRCCGPEKYWRDEEARLKVKLGDKVPSFREFAEQRIAALRARLAVWEETLAEFDASRGTVTRSKEHM